MLAVVAGFGHLPALAWAEAQAKGPAVLFSVAQDIPPGFEPFRSSGLRPEAELTLTQWGTVKSKFAEHGVKEVLFIGKVDKSILFKNPQFDEAAMGLMAKMKTRNDMNIFAVMAEDLAADGISVASQREYLSGLFMKAGQYGLTDNAAAFEAGAAYGLKIAKEIAGLDIGQTVVVGRESVLAVEAIEGTDEAIKRGGLLARGNPAVVCKVARPHQDDRFDTPAVGAQTLETMAAAGCNCLAIEAEKTIVITPDDFTNQARDKGICLLVV